MSSMAPPVPSDAGDAGPHRPWPTLLPFLVGVAVAAGVGAAAASSAGSTYAGLKRPWFAPPAAVFGPVWTVLYVMIAAAAWLVWRRRGWDHSLTVWSVQLVLNAAWTPLFFGAGRYGLALVEIALLLAAVVATTRLFWSRRRAAGLLLVPYLAWVAYATALNAAIWHLN